MKSVQHRLAHHESVEFLSAHATIFLQFVKLGSLTCETVRAGKKTRRGHSALARNKDNQSSTW